MIPESEVSRQSQENSSMPLKKIYKSSSSLRNHEQRAGDKKDDLECWGEDRELPCFCAECRIARAKDLSVSLPVPFARK